MEWNSPQHPSQQSGWGRGGVNDPAPPAHAGPRWARKRIVLPAAGLAFLLGLGMGAAAEQPGDTQLAAAKTRPAPTVTVTETAKVTVTASPEPAPTVTKIKEIRVTVTAPAPAPVQEESAAREDGTGGDDTGGQDSGGASVYYENCTAVRAAGAAPIRAGDPGYDGHLDRDGDGVACE